MEGMREMTLHQVNNVAEPAPFVFYNFKTKRNEQIIENENGKLLVMKIKE